MATETPTLLRLDRVLERRGRSRAQTYIDIRRGILTPPVHISERGLSVWPATEIDALLRAEIAGATREQLQQLVRELLGQRQAGRPRAA